MRSTGGDLLNAGGFCGLPIVELGYEDTLR
jgi:hypothetical protein